MDTLPEILDLDLEEDVSALEALFVQLSCVSRWRMQRDLDAHNLTVPQYMTLRCILESSQGCSMSDLAQSSHQVTATMTGIVDRLVERGLVERTRHPHDRRALRVLLTPAGRQLMAAVSVSRHTLTRQAVVALSPEERQAMILAARHFLTALENSVRSDQRPLTREG